MKHIKLTEDKTNSIVSQLQDVGYTATTKDKYVRYSKEYGNSVFIHHNLSIVRCRINTEASKIIERNLGKANGKAPESQDNGKSLSWFLNGYDGKSTTKIL